MKNYFLLLSFFLIYQVDAQQEWIFGDSLSSLPGVSMAFDIQNTPAGGFVLFGETDFPTGAIRHNSRLLHTSSDGNILLDTTYYLGDIVSEIAEAVYPTEGGDFLLLVRNLDFMEVRKVNSAGEIIWTNPLSLIYEFTDLKIDNEGDILLIGVLVIDVPFSTDPSIVKLDGNTGNILWEKSYPLQPTSYLHTLKLFSDGSAIAGGYNGSAGLLMRFDSEGDTLWTKNIYYSISDQIYDVDICEDGSILFCGSITGFAGHSPSIGKTAPNGEVEWISLPITTLGVATGIVHLPDNSIRVTGSAYENVFFQYEPIGFLAEISSSGEVISEETWSEGKNGSAIISVDNCFAIAGTENGGFYLRKECLNVNAVEEKKSNNFISIAPNPSSGKFYIHFSESSNLEEKEIQIFDYQGRFLQKNKATSSSLEFDLSNYDNGIYLITIIEKGEVIFSKKVILQKNKIKNQKN